VALAWSGTPEIVTAECGILVPPESPAQVSRALADAIMRLAASPELRRRLGEAARQRVVALFSPESLAEKMRVIYRESVTPAQ
jgi:glycosyltransferase involved in cell wall biosynthesis